VQLQGAIAKIAAASSATQSPAKSRAGRQTSGMVAADSTAEKLRIASSDGPKAAAQGFSSVWYSGGVVSISKAAVL
jgi:hypothetical protein